MNNSLNLVVALMLGLLSTGPAQAAFLTLDTNFRPLSFAEPFPAGNTLLLPDGKFLLFGQTDTLTDQRTGALTRYLQDGTLDVTFSFSRDYKFIAAAASIANGQLIIAATPYVYGVPRMEQILRLNVDGSIDSSFNAPFVDSDSFSKVRAIVIQPDGKILVAGSFDTFAGQALQKIVRLLADGTLDSTFTPPQFTAGAVGIYARPVVLANGKILIAGNFTTVNGAANLGVAQLNADGSLDPGFQASGFTRGNGNGTPVRGMVVQNEGRIVLAGRFVFAPSPGLGYPLLGLTANGSKDPSFNSAHIGTNSLTARDLIVQPDGKLVAPINGSIYRFEAAGPLDGSFMRPSITDTTDGFDPGIPLTLSLQPDGRILFAGFFTDVYSSGAYVARFGVARLNSDGTLDPTLTTSHKTGLEDFPSSFARQPDGTSLVSFGIQYSKNDLAIPSNLGRLLPNGVIDSSFSLSSSNPDGILSRTFVAQDFIELADGGFFVFGSTFYTPGEAAKFHSSGAEDLDFEFPFPPEGLFQTATAYPDGGVLLSTGTDAQALASTFSALLRFQNDGSLAFFGLPASIGLEQIIRDNFGYILRMYVGNHVLAVQPDGKILFSYLSSDELFHFLRLNTDGSVDDSFTATTLAPFDLTESFPPIFDPWSGLTLQPNGGVWTATSPLADAQILPDGRILLCGRFISFNGVAARGMVRLLPNGTLDDTFAIGGGAQWTQTTETASFFPSVESIEQQVDGKLLIAGTFEAFNGTALPGIASLNPDGSVDASFTSPVKRQKFVRGSARLARQADGSFLLSGPYAFPNENEPSFIHINSIGGVPVVGSPAIATAHVSQPFSYQIVASGQPTSYSASGLPVGFAIDAQTGLITGTPTSANIGVYTISVTATNGEGASATFYVTLSIIPSQIGPSPNLLNISTRLRVLTGDNALIGGFIITGFKPMRVIVRAIGPSLANAGVSGALADTVLELHGPDTFITITNDNWRDTQQSEIEATGIPPGNDLESAIVATLPPGAYTAIVRGKSDSTGVGLVEAYDLGSTTFSHLANISTRGFVDTGESVMIGGLIAGPPNAGSSRMLVRAIGPSLASQGVPNALQNPALELHDGNGTMVASNNDWRDTQQPSIEATGIAPLDDNEAAILWVLSPGNYTAIVQGEDNGAGVGIIEVYNLQ